MVLAIDMIMVQAFVVVIFKNIVACEEMVKGLNIPI